MNDRKETALLPEPKQLAGSFDGQDVPITGDACVNGVVPATSTWGLVVMWLMVAVAGSVLCRSRPAMTARPTL